MFPCTGTTVTIRSCRTASASSTRRRCSSSGWVICSPRSHLLHTYAGRAGGNRWMLAYEDIVIAYTAAERARASNRRCADRCRACCRPTSVKPLVAWVQEGTDRAKYETDVKPTLDKRCMTCHDGSNPHLHEPERIRQPEEGDRDGHRRRRLHARPRVAHPPVRTDLHFLHHGPHVQPCLRAAGVAEVRRHRAALRRHRGRCQLLVSHQAVSSVRLGVMLPAG